MSDPRKPPEPLKPSPRPGEPARSPAGEGPERVDAPKIKPDPDNPHPSGVPEAPPDAQRPTDGG